MNDFGKRLLRISVVFCVWGSSFVVLQAQQVLQTIGFVDTDGKPTGFVLESVKRDGVPLRAEQLHHRLLSPGVHELTAEVAGKELQQWEISIADRSAYYGFGERFNQLNEARNVVYNYSNDLNGSKGMGSYKPIPFFMSTKGYGLWVDTYSEASFDLNSQSAVATPHLVIRMAEKRLRLVVIEGPRFPLILDRFTALVGRQKLPPYWSFAPWKSRDYHRSEADVYEDIEKTRQLGLPASVLVLDSPWATNYNTFLLNSKQFADPPAMVKRVHDAGFKLCLWLTPFTNSMTDMPTEPNFGSKIPQTAASNYAEAAAKGYFVKDDAGKPYQTKWWKGTGSLIDFTNPDAKRWWQAQVRQAVQQGADAFKDDAGEGEFVGDARFASGEDTRLMRTRYTVLYNQAMEEVIEKDLKGNGVLFSRSASVGSQNLPFAWGGDNAEDFHNESGLPTVVRAGLSAGLSGISLWGSDTGGYVKTPAHTVDPVLFSRWTEFSAFSPIMEVHSELNLGPWDYGQQALDIYRRYAVLNMSLFPYRYAAAQESARSGMPMMRALVLIHQDDDTARLTEDEYEFGPDFLVAPVISGGTQRTLYIPDGLWRDAWTGKLMPSRKTITVDAPLEMLPLYVRDGAVIPKIPEDVMTLVPASQVKVAGVPALDNRRVYEMYPALVESGGMETFDFEGRKLVRSVRADGGRLLIDGAAAEVELRWRFDKPINVTVDGKAIATQSGEHGDFIRIAHAAHTEVNWSLPVTPIVSGEEPATPVARLRLSGWRTRHELKLAEKAGLSKVDVVYLGDSITERWESGDYKPVWDYYNKDRHALNLGFSGDTTGNLLWRMTTGGELDGLHPKVAVLLIGTNNTSEKHTDWSAAQNVLAIDKVVAEAHTRLPGAKIIVLGILPAGKGKEKEDLDDAIDAELRKRYAGNASDVEYVDVSSAFRDSDRLHTCLYADPRAKPPEGAVHPTPLGQARLAAALEPVLAKDLGVAAKPPMTLADPLCP